MKAFCNFYLNYIFYILFVSVKEWRRCDDLTDILRIHIEQHPTYDMQTAVYCFFHAVHQMPSQASPLSILYASGSSALLQNKWVLCFLLAKLFLSNLLNFHVCIFLFLLFYKEIDNLVGFLRNNFSLLCSNISWWNSLSCSNGTPLIYSVW